MLNTEAQAILENARKRVCSRSNPLLSSLPEWVEGWREPQKDAIAQIMEAFERVDVVVLDAPTGTGKTLIGETVRRLMETDAVYICSSKSLQQQFLKDFPYAALIQGRNNYPTELYPDKFVSRESWSQQLSCADCQGKSCSWCSSTKSCPYRIAKELATINPLAVLNTTYSLYEFNQRGTAFAGRGLVIADECDTLEGEFMGYVSVEVGQKWIRKLDLGYPRLVTKPEAWKEWLENAIPRFVEYLKTIPRSTSDVALIKERRTVEGFITKLIRIAQEIDDGHWVYTGTDDKVSFKPVKVDTIGEGIFWQHGQKFLLMSGSVISSSELLRSLGYYRPHESISIDCSFPVENRKVVARPIANMSRKANEIDALKRGIGRVLQDHPDQSILIHTVSYALAKEIEGGIRGYSRPTITYTSANEREKALTSFKQAQGKAPVLIASSMDRGIDLPHDLCRVQIIAKVPFPFLGDRQISARLHSSGGQTWYTVNTIRTVLQMTGRAVRSHDDYAVTYILDSQFKTMIWEKNNRLFPKWWREGLVWET